MFHLLKESRIPLNTDGGQQVSDFVQVAQDGTVADISMVMELTDSNVHGMALMLKSPSGQKVNLNHEMMHMDNNQVTIAGEVFNSFIGKKANGKWSLTAEGAQVNVSNWGLKMSVKPSDDRSQITIPDNDAVGLVSTQICRMNGMLTGLEAMVDIEHGYVGDLHVKLVAPSGQEVTLHNRTGGNKNNLKETYSGDMFAPLMGTSIQGEWKLVLKDYAPRDAGTLKHWKLRFKFQSKDDLKKVEGIGPKIEGLLNNAGIHSWSKLSTTSVDRLKEILADAGERYKMHDPGTWPDQAALAAAGKWDELKAWQDQLDGGK